MGGNWTPCSDDYEYEIVEEEDFRPIKYVYPRIELKSKIKANSRPDYVSVHKQAVFAKFISMH